MPDRQSKSFVEVTFIEAAARRVRVDLVMEPIVPAGERRLISRFIGVENPDQIVLAPPVTARGEKVFVPTGWELGMSFDLANVWFQATTTVLEHCMFYQAPTRKVDALAVRLPEKLLSGNRRQAPRHHADPDKPTFVTIWSADRIEDENVAPIVAGRLQDWSTTGIGVRLNEPIDLPTGSKAVVCLDTHDDESHFLRATLRHCTPLGDGAWVVGFGDIASLKPGEALNLMSLLASPAS